MSDLIRIFIASDHSGIEVKEAIIKHLEDTCQLIDLGPNDPNKSVNYAEYGIACAEKCVEHNALGIVICGTGIGISIAANKVKGARCAMLYNNEVAALSKQHNNANILSFGARQFSISKILEMIDIFLKSKFEGDRHNERLKFIDNYKNK